MSLFWALLLGAWDLEAIQEDRLPDGHSRVWTVMVLKWKVTCLCIAVQLVTTSSPAMLWAQFMDAWTTRNVESVIVGQHGCRLTRQSTVRGDDANAGWTCWRCNAQCVDGAGGDRAVCVHDEFLAPVAEDITAALDEEGL